MTITTGPFAATAAPPAADHAPRLEVAVVGVGYVGACLGAVLSESESAVSRVLCVDVDEGVVEALNDGRCHIVEPGLDKAVARAVEQRRLAATTDVGEVAGADVVLITVGTPIADDGSIDTTQLAASCRALAPALRPGQLVILKSTVAPGTTREVALPILASGGLRPGVDFHLAYCPERLAESTALDELRHLPVVVAGLDAESTAAASGFWRRALGVTTLVQASLEAAEIVKLADNWWIDLNIALANELAQFCAAYRVDVLDVISAANTIAKGAGSVNILRPSVGVGGSCLTKDPWMVWRAARDRGVQIRTPAVGREVNDRMPAYAARLVLDHLAGRPRPVVAVFGAAFKNNSGDLRATPVAGFVEELRDHGVEVRLFDPLVDGEQARARLGLAPLPTAHDAARGASCVAVLARHDEFDRIDFGTLEVADDCLLFDGRGYYPRDWIDRFQRAGYTYRGIGR